MFPEKAWHWIACHLPRKLVYWCGIVMWAKATTGKYSGEECTGVPMDTILKRWDEASG